MGVKSRMFKCGECNSEFYADYEECINCCERGTIKPIPREHYRCYLNGKFYGSGTLEYIHELFKDYVVTCEMYNKDYCGFEIVKDSLV